MARVQKLKAYHGNLDGLRRGFVLATSQTAAAAVVGCSVGAFRDYWSKAPKMPEQEIKPGVLYTRPYDSAGPWIEGRCELRSGV